MPRYIDADEAKSKLVDLIAYNPYNILESVYLSDALHKIDECQTLDVKPITHAHWIKHKNAEERYGLLITQYECSNCHEWFDDNSSYCPECGALM